MFEKIRLRPLAIGVSFLYIIHQKEAQKRGTKQQRTHDLT